jgi:hypothetical protein
MNPIYFVVGVDGREYGPATADQVRQWITEKRANAHTRTRLADTTVWKTLSEFPEFATLFSQPPLTASPPSSAPPPDLRGGSSEGDRIAAEILSRGYDLRIGHCIGRGWHLVTSRFWLTVGTTFIVVVLSLGVGSIPFLGAFASFALAYVLFGGLDWFFLKVIRGQPADVGDAFSGFTRAFVPLLLFSIVGQLLTSVGFLFCILPGIYLTIAWLMLTTLIILDKNLEFWPAMELSRRVVSRHWWQFFGLFLLCMIINFLGALACCVGFFITLPVTTAAIVYAYEDVFNPQLNLAMRTGLAPMPASVPAAAPATPSAPANPPPPNDPAI